MTGFDLCVIAILAASLLLGLWRGLVSEVLALAAWVLALLAGKMFAGEVAPALAGLIKDPTLQMFTAFALIAVGVILLVALLRLLLRELLKAAGLGVTDRVLGACFGLGRGLLVVLLGVLVAGLTSLPRAAWWQESMLAPPLETAVMAAKPWMPAVMAKRIKYR
ncbi:MAG: CvpA family protein [Candidatus Methylophosphatis roskildensis]|uniref:CvpA family protein n=1 Tax=Candidatus Methylophosphatis roskildensis TaxID=2899263 RepID=A0A9D7E9L9_9PROT|nr:CvpA family protein [Candidatus Methylophosphatis roskildensis]MBK7235425.1 CvpA family protein [Sterolibacteriaceae bacterium]